MVGSLNVLLLAEFLLYNLQRVRGGGPGILPYHALAVDATRQPLDGFDINLS